MKNKKSEPMQCEICGKIFMPGRKNQRTCGAYECRQERHKQQKNAWRKRNLNSSQEDDQQLYKQKRRKKEEEPKPDTIIAIGYAERQMAATLNLVGRVKTEL